MNLVLSIAKAYADGDFSAVPTSSGGTTTFTPDYGDSVFASGTSGYKYPKGKGHGTSRRSSGGSGYSGGSSSSGGTPAPPTSGGTPTTSGGGSVPGTGGVPPAPAAAAPTR